MATRTTKPTVSTPDHDKPIIVEAMGVKTTLHPKIFDDWHTVELMAELEDNAAPSTVVKFMRTILGDQYDRVMHELELEDGSIPVERVTEYMQELLKGVDPNS